MEKEQGKNGLSKTTTLQQDIAKPGAVNLGKNPNIGQNHVAFGTHAAAHNTPGGVTLPNNKVGNTK